MTNWGILGTGNIAKTFASAIKETDRSTLLAVGSRSKDSADLFASTYNCIGFDNYQKLLDDKDKRDFLYSNAVKRLKFSN